MQDDFSLLVEKVERRRAEKVAKFLELLRDPDLAAYVAILRSGEQPEPPKGAGFTPPIGFKNGNGIRDAIRGLTLPARFTSDEILKALEEIGFPFSSKDHKSAVRDAVYKLTTGTTPEFRKFRTGKGGHPNVYERIMQAD